MSRTKGNCWSYDGTTIVDDNIFKQKIFLGYHRSGGQPGRFWAREGNTQRKQGWLGGS